MKYLASYVQHFWRDGRCSKEKFVVADSLEELLQKIAEVHYESRFYSDTLMRSSEHYTDEWTIYQSHVYSKTLVRDVNKLPEFVKMVEEREQRALEHEISVVQKDIARRTETERALYERLKKKFEGV